MPPKLDITSWPIRFATDCVATCLHYGDHELAYDDNGIACLYRIRDMNTGIRITPPELVCIVPSPVLFELRFNDSPKARRRSYLRVVQ
jgi:hypothetical protein